MNDRKEGGEQPVEWIEDYIPMPRELWSFETGRPFAACIECGKSLVADGTPYLIEKAFRGDEVVVEFAWCFSCHDAMQERYSKETRTRIWDFFLDRSNLPARRARLRASNPLDLAAWTSACLTCGRSGDDIGERLLLAQGDGGDLLFYYLPYLLCEHCQSAIIDLMSNASLGIWGDWIEENLPTFPELSTEPGRRRLLLV